MKSSYNEVEKKIVITVRIKTRKIKRDLVQPLFIARNGSDYRGLKANLNKQKKKNYRKHEQNE